MLVGIKLYSPDVEYARKIKNAEFIELVANPYESYLPFIHLGKPIVLHNVMGKLNKTDTNPMNPEKEELTRFTLKTSKRIAKILKPPFIVVHPGYKETGECSLEFLINLLNEECPDYNDYKFLIENMPDSKPYACKTPEEVERIMKETGMGFCFDFAHFSTLGKPELLHEFLKLRPDYFHVSDNERNNPHDEHLHIGDGELDIKGFIQHLPEDAMVAIETPPDFEKHIRDIRLIKQSANPQRTK